MLTTKKDGEISHYFHFDLDLNNFFPSFTTKEEDYNYDELNNALEEKIFYISPIKNKLKKKEINFNKQKIDNKNQETNNNKSSNEIEDKNISGKNIYNNKFKAISLSDVVYRKDAYYKYFKANLGRYIKNKINVFKNKCFPLYFRNNFSSPNYRYTGNPKEKDNFIFLTFTIKALLIFGKNKVKFNRQYNNELIINFIEKNESKAKDRNAYKELIIFLNETLEDAIIQFYDDENEFNKMKNDSKFFHFDEFYKRETGISLLEKYGFLKALKK